MAYAAHLNVGVRVHADGCLHTVVAKRADTVKLRDGDGVVQEAAVGDLVARPDFRVLGGSVPPEVSEAALLRAFPPDEVERAGELIEHLLEMRTGYRSGTSSAPRADEPRAAYDCEQVSEPDRVRAKSDELGALGMSGVAPGTLRNLWTAYQRDGLLGLLDGRRMANGRELAAMDARTLLAAEALATEMSSKSDISIKNFCRQVRVRLEEAHGVGVVDVPPETTFRRRMREFGRLYGLFSKHAKRRQQDGLRPTDSYYRCHPQRPSEFVGIDATPLNLFAIDDETLEVVRVEMLWAFDVFDASAVGVRLTPAGTSRVDAALLLRDIVMPKVMRPDWPAEAAWSYRGVPDNIVVDICEQWGLQGPPAGIPFVHPETVIADNAWAYGSLAFREGCRKLGITIHMARPARPTDKAHIERFVGLVQQDFIQNLPGYTGHDILSRGRHPERDAFYFLSELEAMLWEWVACVYQRRPHDGCRLGPACKLKLSPNDMVELGFARAGFPRVPAHPDLYYDLLPVQPAAIGHAGIAAFGLDYDGDALHPYRGLPSGIGGRMEDKWPFAYDPRDATRVYFRDPATAIWHEIPCVNLRIAGSFGQATLELVKRKVRERGGIAGTQAYDELIEAEMRAMLRRRSENSTELGERRAFRRAAIAESGKRRDHETAPVAVIAEPHDGVGEDHLLGQVIEQGWSVPDTALQNWGDE